MHMYEVIHHASQVNHKHTSDVINNMLQWLESDFKWECSVNLSMFRRDKYKTEDK